MKEPKDQFEIMIDVETLATNNRAVILSAGAVVIDTDTNTVVDEAYWVLDWEEQANYGRNLDPQTLKWWFSQPLEAQRVIYELVPRLPDEQFTKEFYAFFAKHGTKTVWANGVNFDVRLLEDFFQSQSIQDVTFRYVNGVQYGRHEDIHPWHWSKTYDLRSLRLTMEDIMPYDDFKEAQIAAGMTAHNALDDARIQAAYVIGVREWIKSRQSLALPDAPAPAKTP